MDYSIYYLLLFAVFIGASNVIYKGEGKRAAANIKSAVLSIAAVAVIWLLNALLMYAASYLGNTSDTAGYIASFGTDIVVPVCVTVPVIFMISRFFAYGVRFPKWIIIVALVLCAVACPLYLERAKKLSESIDMMFVQNSGNVMSLLDMFTAEPQDMVLIEFISRMPAIILGVFLFIRNLTKNK